MHGIFWGEDSGTAKTEKTNIYPLKCSCTSATTPTCIFTLHSLSIFGALCIASGLALADMPLQFGRRVQQEKNATFDIRLSRTELLYFQYLTLPQWAKIRKKFNFGKPQCLPQRLNQFFKKIKWSGPDVFLRSEEIFSKNVDFSFWVSPAMPIFLIALFFHFQSTVFTLNMATAAIIRRINLSTCFATHIHTFILFLGKIRMD